MNCGSLTRKTTFPLFLFVLWCVSFRGGAAMTTTGTCNTVTARTPAAVTAIATIAATATVMDPATAVTVTTPSTTTTSHRALAVKEITLTATGGTPPAAPVAGLAAAGTKATTGSREKNGGNSQSRI